ncbi:MAG: M15 family metallopeptidase [Lachnospiraceae bacterium]|jgi:D-alanyl-D-alanine carboxypeptidase|nr:M15 family metallopeptidase [Lachnospiraceae bacterium]
MLRKDSLKTKVRQKIASISKKNWCCFILMLPVLILFHAYFNSGRFLKENQKRLLLLPATFILIAVFSSFSFPLFSEEGAQDTPQIETQETSEYTVTLAKTNDVNPDELVLIEDEDVMDETDETVIHGAQTMDQYAADEILEYNADLIPSVETVLPEQTQKIVFEREDWRLLLVNKQYPVPDGYSVILATIKGSMKCDERIIEDLLAMLQAAKKDDMNLLVQSPYRDEARQEMLFERKIDRYLAKGLSYLEAFRLSSQTVTVPGYSEHQIGLALDIASDSYMSLDAGFGETDEGKWLREHCAQYGFILRYPSGKEDITGIEYEPWHFRYVGKEAAAIIMEEQITLEEFWDRYFS